MELRTDRLLLRRWRPADREPFAALNADPEVMAYLPGGIGREASDAIVDRIEAHFERHGFGLWAVEVAGGPPFIGFVGVQLVAFEADFVVTHRATGSVGAVEVGWRLARPYWGQGYASEAARAAVPVAFAAGWDEVVSFTVAANVRSQQVMERIGMQRDPAGDFEHPRLPVGHPLRPHILYRLRANPLAPPPSVG